MIQFDPPSKLFKVSHGLGGDREEKRQIICIYEKCKISIKKVVSYCKDFVESFGF